MRFIYYVNVSDCRPTEGTTFEQSWKKHIGSIERDLKKRGFMEPGDSVIFMKSDHNSISSVD